MIARWHTEEIEPGDVLIQNGHVIVGSIKCIVGTPGRFSSWSVEILWSGPGGDIKSEFSDHAQALAFVQGVEKTITALGLSDPRMAGQVHGEPR